MQIDYSILEHQVAEWQDGYIQHVWETYGEDFAANTERQFEDEPWAALKWFVEDMAA